MESSEGVVLQVTYLYYPREGAHEWFFSERYLYTSTWIGIAMIWFQYFNEHLLSYSSFLLFHRTTSGIHFPWTANHDKVHSMEKKQYVCPKCGCIHYEDDRFQATGGNFAKIFDVQNKRFVTITCTQCGFTELYKQTSSTGWNVLDFLLSW